MSQQIQIRRDTEANWTSTDPILAQGELGYETDTDKLKIGDGSNIWSELLYFAGGSGDMVLDTIQSVTGLKTFDKDKLAMKGTSTGTTVLSTANTSATNYTLAMPTANGTIALTSDIITTASAVINTPSGNIAATDVQSALNELDAEKQSNISGASLTNVTVATDDKVIIQDTSDSNNIKTVTAQSIADLGGGGGGGQTIYTFIVAGSGGDYATLGAALAAASDNDTIFVRRGTYTETGNITCSLANISIIGEGLNDTIIDLSTYTMELSGAYAQINNIQITATTGGTVFSGDYHKFINSKIVKSTGTTNYGMQWYGNYGTISNSILDDTTTSDGNYVRFSIGGIGTLINNNIINLRIVNASGEGTLSLGGNKMIVTNNYISKVSGTTAGSFLVTWYSTDGIFSGNTLYSDSSVAKSLYCGTAGNITGNLIIGGLVGIQAKNGVINITGNTIKSVNNSMTYGVLVSISDCVVTGNNLYGSSTSTGSMVGISVYDVSTPPDNVVITGNRVKNCVQGINISSSSSDYIVVTGNNCRGNGTNLVDNGTNTVVSGNASA